MKHILEYAPFDSHVHFRRGAMMRAVAKCTSSQCWGAVVMPNTAPHILTPEDAEEYVADIRSIVGTQFYVVMTGYLTPETKPEEVERGFHSGAWSAMKVYPPGATTYSNEGVVGKTLLNHPALSLMQEIGMPLLLHGEVNHNGTEVDPYDREDIFIDTVLVELLERFPNLKISLEHITTEHAAMFMMKYGSERLVCTVTAHHLLLDRRDFFRGGPNPHLHCWPVLKRSKDREALRDLAVSGAPYVSAGTDSAPHPTTAKERACGCAGGVFTAHAMVPLYTQVFSERNALGKLEAFLCLNGPRFYGLAPKPAIVELEDIGWKRRSMIEVEGGALVRPFGYHENIKERYVFPWRIANFHN